MYSVFLAESPSKRQKRSHADDGAGASNGSTTTVTADKATSSTTASSSSGPITPNAHIEQLITEHLGFDIRVYIDQLTQLANDYVHQLKADIESEVREKLTQSGLSADPELEAEQGVHSLITLVENSLDHTFDTFELYCLRSVLRITPAQARVITLAHHRGLDLRSVEEKRAYLERKAGRQKGAKGSSRSKRDADTTSTVTEPVQSAQEISRALAEESGRLRKKIAASRANNAALRAAAIRAEGEVDAAQRQQDALPPLFGGLKGLSVDGLDESAMNVDDSAGIDEPNGDHATAISVRHPLIAEKVQSTAAQLLELMETLKGSDPLGTALGSGTTTGHGAGVADTEAESGGASATLPWSSREGFLKFVADKARS